MAAEATLPQGATYGALQTAAAPAGEQPLPEGASYGAPTPPTAAQATKAAHPGITDPATAAAVQRTETSGQNPDHQATISAAPSGMYERGKSWLKSLIANPEGVTRDLQEKANSDEAAKHAGPIGQVVPGLTDIAHAIVRPSDTTKDKVGALNEFAGGVMKATGPFAAVASPTMIPRVIAGMGAQKATQGILDKYTNLEPEYKEAAGNVAGLAAGGAPELADRAAFIKNPSLYKSRGLGEIPAPTTEAPSTSPTPGNLGKIKSAAPDIGDQEITPEMAAQSAAAQGIKPVTRHAEAPNSPMNKYDVVNNTTEAPKAPSANETLNLPENTVRPGKQEALPPAPEQKLLPEKSAPVQLPKSTLGEDIEKSLNEHAEAAQPKAEPEKAIAKTEEPGKIIDQAKVAEPAEKLEEKTKGRAAEMQEKYPIKKVGLSNDQTVNPEAAKTAEPKPETVGTAEGAVKDTDLFAKAKAELGENASISDVAKRAQEMKDGKTEEKAAEPVAIDHREIAQAHNTHSGFTYNPKEGLVRDQPVFSVAGTHPDVEQVLKGRHITEAQVKDFAGRPDVQKALQEDERHSIGGWNYKGNSHLEISKLFHDRDEAIAEGKRLNQDSIYDHAKRESIPTGGTAAEDAAKAAGVEPTEEPKAEETKQTEPDQKLTETDQRGLEKRLGAEAAADTSTEGREKQQRLLKGTNAQYAEFANEQGPEKPGGGEWQSSDFSKKGTGGKTVPANKKLVIDHAMTNIPHDEFMDATSEWGPPTKDLGEKFEGKGPAPEATPETAKMSDEELLKKGFTKEDIEAAKHVPGVGGGASAQTALAKEKGIPESVSKNMTPEEIQSANKTPRTTEKFVEKLAKIPEVQEYIDIALQGEGARKWYERSAQAFDVMKEADPKYFGEEGDKDKFIGMLAGSSPRQSVAMNLREALGGWKSWVDAGRPELSLGRWKAFIDAGRPKGPEWATENMLVDNFTLPETKMMNVIKAMNGEELWPDLSKNEYFKVPSFDKNLKGWLNHVTNDGWMALFAGLDPKTIGKPENYHPLSIATRAAANALGWEAADAQAAIWSFTQSLTEKGETDPNIIREYSEDFADLLANDPETRSLMNQLGVSNESLDKHIAERVEAKPEISGRTTASTARSVGKLGERIEAARGKGVIPTPKSNQGQLFGREDHPVRAKAEPEAKDTSFNPNEMEEAEKPDVKVLELSNRPEKKILSIKIGGERAGQFSLTPTPELGEGSMEVSTSQLKKEFQGEGHGTEAYRQAIDYAKKQGVKTLYSDDQVSTKANNVWKSLLEKGEAEWDVDKSRYRIDLEPKHRMGKSTVNPLDKYRT